MNELYEWLYDEYASTQLKQASMPDYYCKQEADWNQVIGTLESSVQLQATDWLDCLKVCWGTEAFRLGVEFGLALKSNIA